MNPFFLEKFKLTLYICFISAETVKLFYNKSITTSENLLFKVLVSLTFCILAGALVNDYIIFADTKSCQSFDLSVLILLTSRNTGIAESSVIHNSLQSVSKSPCTSGTSQKSKMDFLTHVFNKKMTVPESKLFGTVK